MTQRFKRIIPIVVLTGFVLGCANKQAPVELQPGLQQLEVLHRVQELQRTVIAIHDAAPTKLSKDNADLIVRFTLAANDVISTGASGWKNQVKVMWSSLKKAYTPPPNFLPVWSIVDTLITGLV